MRRPLRHPVRWTDTRTDLDLSGGHRGNHRSPALLFLGRRTDLDCSREHRIRRPGHGAAGASRRLGGGGQQLSSAAGGYSTLGITGPRRELARPGSDPDVGPQCEPHGRGGGGPAGKNCGGCGRDLGSSGPLHLRDTRPGAFGRRQPADDLLRHPEGHHPRPGLPLPGASGVKPKSP